jgi:hypothetical protein
MSNTRHSCQILIKLEFSRQILEKYSHIKFQNYPPLRAGLFHAEGQTEGHEANSRFS